MKHTFEELKQWQSLPLSVKVLMTKARIREWIKTYGEDGVYISFSGGKDSTVLLDLVRQDYPNVPALFVDVPTQYPELREFAKSFPNVDVVKPNLTFMQVCEKYGFPLISKEVSQVIYEAKQQLQGYGSGKIYKYGKPCRLLQLEGKLPHTENGKITDEFSKQYDKSRYAWLLDAPFNLSHHCCNVMKKKPIHQYAKETGRVGITAQMADESRLRTQKWLQNGCNGFNLKKPISNPMAFWTEQDVLQYIKQNNLPICSVYGDIVEDLSGTDDVENQMTFSDLGYGKEFDAPEHPLKTTGCSRTGCMLCGFGCHLEKSPNRFEQLKETHPGMYKLLDVVKNNGVTMREAIEWMNENGGTDIKL